MFGTGNLLKAGCSGITRHQTVSWLQPRNLHTAKCLLEADKPHAANETSSSVSHEEVAKFGAQAGQWWDHMGPFRTLHEMNPIRLTYIRSVLEHRFRISPGLPRPFENFSIVDIGCGGGLLSEPLARLGATVTGVDPANDNVAAATAHAELTPDLKDNLSYKCTTAEEVQQTGEAFDIVMASEVLEHVANPARFVGTCGQLVKPGGVIIFSTINRTPCGFAKVVAGAEYVAKYVPRGTHDYEKFVKPEELVAVCAKNGLELVDVSGILYSLLGKNWSIGPDLSANYMMTVGKPAPQ